MKRLKYILLGLSLLVPLLAVAAPNVQNFTNIQPFVTNTYDNGTSTNIWNRLFARYASTTVTSATALCLTGDTCITTWPTGTPGGSSGQLQYNASGAFGGVATSSLTGTGVVTISNSPSIVGSSGAVASLTGGSGGQILAWLGGVAAWTATSTFTSPLVFTASTNAVTCPTCNTSGATVSSIATNNGITGGTITTTGTIGLATINAGVLGAVTNGAVPTSQATSSLFGVGTNGFVLAEVGGIPSWVATTTLSTISGLLNLSTQVTNTLGVGNGGTGQTSFKQGWLGINDSGAFIASTSPTVAWFTATSTTATSSVAYGLNVSTSGGCLAIAGVCVTNAISNISAFKAASNYATTVALPANTYLAGVLTEVGTGALSVDGATPAVGNRILVKNETTQTNNGIYNVTVVGSGIAAYVLTRSSDFNTNADVYPGVSTYILSGTANGDTTWTLTTPAPVVLDTSNLTFTESANGNITLPISIANGGTGQVTASAAFNALSPLTTLGDILYGGSSGAGTRLGIGTAGQVLGIVAGVPAWVATSTSGGSTFGQSFEIDSSNWLSPTTTNKYGVNTSASGLTYGFGIGDSLLAYASSTNYATVFGLGAGGQNATTSSTISSTTAIGFNALQALTTSPSNTAVGAFALTNYTGTGGNNTAVGNAALQNASLGASSTVAVGSQAGYAGGGSRGTYVGSLSGLALGSSISVGFDNVLLGWSAGSNLTSGEGNIVIGSGAQTKGVSSVTGNRQLDIGNTLYGANIFLSSGNPSTEAQVDGKIGVGTTTPRALLSVQAVGGGTTPNVFQIGSSTAAFATSTLFNIDNTGLITTTLGTGCVLSSSGILSVIGSTCTSGTVTSITAGAGLNGGSITTSGTVSLISYVATSTAETKGQLAVWGSSSAFPALLYSQSTSTLTASSPLTGSFTQIGSGGSIGCQTASGSQAGCLSSTDWNTFNGKLSNYDAFSHLTNFGVTMSATSSALWAQQGIFASTTGSTPSWIDQLNIGSTTIGALATSTDFGNFAVLGNASSTKLYESSLVSGNCLQASTAGLIVTTAGACGSGTVTAVSVATANGFAGSSSGGATPALTLTTTITGILKGNGTAIAAAAYTDFPTISANSVLANVSSASAAPSSLATSSLFTLGAGLTTVSSISRQVENRSFSYATTTAWTGTTTIPLEIGYGEVWNNVKCDTKPGGGGTLNVQFGYGTASTTMFNASTTIGTVTLASNNTMTSGNRVVVDIGTPATTPTQINCTVNDTN